MRELSDSNGSDGYGEAPGETGNTPTSSTGKVFYQDLIYQANTVPIITVFKHYGLRINEYNNRTTCPFKSHQGGRERTPSFNYYPDTNSYYCFGCKCGGSVCNFVSEMDSVNKDKAAIKVLSLFKNSVGEEEYFSVTDLSERLDIMMDFSNTVREFRFLNFDEKDHLFIEGVCAIYDDLYAKHHSKNKTLDNKALRRIVGLFKEKITNYTCHKQ